METTIFQLTLFEGDDVKEKLTVMDQLEAMFDDERNEIPESYWDLVENIKQGDTIEFVIRKVV